MPSRVSAARVVVLLLVAGAGCGGEGAGAGDADAFGGGAAGDGAAGDGVAGDSGSDSTDAGGPAPASLQWLDLGEVSTAADGTSAERSFELPADVTAVTVVLSSASPAHLQLAAWRQPGDIDIVPQAWLDTSATAALCLGPCVNRILAKPGVAAFLAPNTPLIELVPGQHQLRIFAFDGSIAGEEQPVATTVRVQVAWVRRDSQRRHLDVNIALTGARGLTASTAPSDANLAVAIDGLRAALAQAGFELVLRWADVPKELRFVQTRDGADSDLAKLFASGAALPAGLNVFLVEQIALASGGPPGLDLLLGVSSGIPGDPRGQGHARAGVAIALGLGLDDPALLGRVMAHEIGHYLGLFHTTEAPSAKGTTLADNLPDTPAPDPTNLMHWTVGAATSALRHEQVEVLRRSAMLAALPEAHGKP